MGLTLTYFNSRKLKLKEKESGLEKLNMITESELKKHENKLN